MAWSRTDVEAMCLIAPSVEQYTFKKPNNSSLPTLIIQGTQDEVVASSAVHAWSTKLPYTPQLILCEGAGHLFHG